MHHRLFHLLPLLGLILSSFVPGCLSPAWAQGPSGSTGQSSDFPDAIVLVEAAGDQATVAVTYARAVPHAKARRSIVRLARLAGWKLATPVVKDEELFGYTDSGERRSLGRQTGLEVKATGVNLYDGSAFKLQPFVEAYQDENRLDLFFMTGGLARFTGLRSFSHPAVSVTLLKDQGPYRYRVDIRQHTGALPKLPIDEPAPAVQPNAAVQGTTSGGRPSPYGLIAVIAACAGLAAFAALRLLTALYRRGRSGPLPKSGRPLHSGPYIVSPRPPSRKD